MPKYIDKDKLTYQMKDRLNGIVMGHGYNDYLQGYAAAIKFVENASIAAVQEVKHAKWAHLGGDEWCCSYCGFVKHTEGSWEKPTAKYCEECGAEINRCDTPMQEDDE